MSKAVIFFAPGLEECEGLLCVDLLRRSGVEVTIAAVGGEKVVKSARSISVVADALAEELDYSAFDAAILPGGIPGVDNLKADATVRKVCTVPLSSERRRLWLSSMARRSSPEALRVPSESCLCISDSS